MTKPIDEPICTHRSRAERRRELVRESLIENQHVPHRVGADGKTYKRLPRPAAKGGA